MACIARNVKTAKVKHRQCAAISRVVGSSAVRVNDEDGRRLLNVILWRSCLISSHDFQESVRRVSAARIQRACGRPSRRLAESKVRPMQLDSLLACSRSFTPKPSGPLHANMAKTISDLRILALEVVEIVTAQTATRVNCLAPVDQLPDDTLALILLQLDSHTTFLMTKVSRRWRNMVLLASSLWASIDLSCCPREFKRWFQLFVERSQNAPLDLKLVMESTEIDTSHVRKDRGEVLCQLWSEQCADDVSTQLGGCIEDLALVPDVFARLRTLDLTSLLSTDPEEHKYDKIKRPTPTLQLRACSSLRRLRLNWAEPDVHELHLILDSELGAFDSVSSLALCAVDNLREVLPRFPRVICLSLWLGQPQESTRPDIQLADISKWMPQLRQSEIAEVPDDFASKPLTTRHRCVVWSSTASSLVMF